MRRGLRVTAAILMAYLAQATVLPYFKVSGVMLDLMSITVITVGFSRGAYVGITGGLFGALLLESVTGDLAGLTAVACISAGAYGTWIAKRAREYVKVGNRIQERLVKQFAPMVAAGLFVGLKETIYVIYFYLTGVDIVFIHIFKVFVSVVETMLMSLILMPLLNGFFKRDWEETLLFKWVSKRRATKKKDPLMPDLPQRADPPPPKAFLVEEDDGGPDDQLKPDTILDSAPDAPTDEEEPTHASADMHASADTAARRRFRRPTRDSGRAGEDTVPPVGGRRSKQHSYRADDAPSTAKRRRVNPAEGGMDD